VTLHNSTPHSSIINEIPYKKLFKNGAVMQKPIIIGTLMITKTRYGDKLAARGRPCYFVGYSKEKTGL
jgi:hypothetical protein